MSCYFDSYFLSGKQTGGLGLEPGQRPGGQGQEAAPSLTRAPCRNRELSRGPSCHPHHPPSVLSVLCPALLMSGFCRVQKSCLAHSSQPSLTCPVCEVGLQQALNTLRLAHAWQWCVCGHPCPCYYFGAAVTLGTGASSLKEVKQVDRRVGSGLCSVSSSLPVKWVHTMPPSQVPSQGNGSFTHSV